MRGTPIGSEAALNMQRKDEILAKKAKLAELRRQREEREQRQKESGKRESLLGEPSEVDSTQGKESQESCLLASGQIVHTGTND